MPASGIGSWVLKLLVNASNARSRCSRGLVTGLIVDCLSFSVGQPVGNHDGAITRRAFTLASWKPIGT
jgi:hypothetical protein